MKKLRVVIADDHPVVREGIERILQENGEFELVGSASNGVEAVKLCEKWLPDLALIDISMPLMNGIEATQQIKKKSSDTRVVILSMHSDKEYFFEAIHNGASGYLSKNEEVQNFPHILKQVASGKEYISQEFSPIFVELIRTQTTPSASSLLTQREREILQLIANGTPTEKIAKQLNMKKVTVNRHRNNMMHKLNVHNTASLVEFAQQHKLVVPDPNS